VVPVRVAAAYRVIMSVGGAAPGCGSGCGDVVKGTALSGARVRSVDHTAVSCCDVALPGTLNPFEPLALA
jgi:hypothetical protein